MKRATLSILIAVMVGYALAESAPDRDVQKMREAYEVTRYSIATQRRSLCDRYLDSRTTDEQKKILEYCRQLLFHTLTDTIFPAFYGTRWGFHGMTRTPGEGEIACGTFVVFTLQDVGFRIPTRMAAQPAENIIKNLVGRSTIKRFSNHAPMSEVIEWLRESGQGLYLVGLDIHVGFIVYQNDKMTFCHASYYDPPRAVVSQEVMEKSPLTDSGYRVIGKLLTDDMIKKWLLGKEFEVTYDYFRE